MADALYCMICSAARSGSTLLDLILGGHSRTASLGEFSFLGKAIALEQDCSCGASVIECDTWVDVFDRLVAAGYPDLRKQPYAMQQWDATASTVVDRSFQTPWYRLRTRARSAQCEARYRFAGSAVPLPPSLSRGLDNLAVLYPTLVDAWNVDVLIDSSKNLHKAVAVHERWPEQTRVVYLTRDGRGVFHSRRSSGFSVDESARGWVRYNDRALAVLYRHLPEAHRFELRYEDLMAEPEQTVASLCAFLGLDYEAGMLRVNPSDHHIVNGNDMRFKPDQTLRHDDRWQREMSADDLSAFESLGGAMNRRLGYQ